MMRLILVGVVLAVSAGGALAMGKWLDDETLKEMSQDVAIIDQPVHIIGPDDDNPKKAERLRECMEHWKHRAIPKSSEELPELRQLAFTVRVWRCMYRTNYTIWTARCPTLAELKKKHDAEPEETAFEEEDAPDDESEEDREAREQRNEEGRREHEERADERSRQYRAERQKAIADMKRPYCYARFR